jgi:hypothetical protein
MSTHEQLYDEQSRATSTRGPAFGAASPPPEEVVPESRGPLDRRTEAALGIAIATPTALGYAALVYGLYLAVTALL